MPGMSFCAISTGFCRFNLLPAPEYVNILKLKCEKAGKTVTYTEQREGQTWTLTVFVDQIGRGKGTGKTVDSAKAAAAKMALERLGWLEYVNMLNNNCQKIKKTVMYADLREGPKHDENWTLTVFVDDIEHDRHLDWFLVLTGVSFQLDLAFVLHLQTPVTPGADAMKVHLPIILFIAHVAGLGIIVPSILIAGIKTQVIWTQDPADSADFDLRFVTTRDNTDVGLAVANIEGVGDYGIVDVIFPEPGTYVLAAVTGTVLFVMRSSRNINIGISNNVNVVPLPVSATTTVTTTVLPTFTPTAASSLNLYASYTYPCAPLTLITSTASSTPPLPTSTGPPSSKPLASFVSDHTQRRRLPVIIGAVIGSLVLLALLTVGVIISLRQRRIRAQGDHSFTFRRSLMVQRRVPPLLSSTQPNMIVTPPDDADGSLVDPERALGDSQNEETPENNSTSNPFILRSPRGPRPRPATPKGAAASAAPTDRQGLLLTRIAQIQAQIRELQSFRATSSAEERQAIVRVIENLYRQLRWLREQGEGEWAMGRTDVRPHGWERYMMSEVRGT
ncbi:hypothetical protein K443DRAFT_123975 [Laccaria amethystina LaAM-08-1]|uniref:DRBM domain-containing protein n=1 Tax=Laccaria amethystina LaAM-08-1 TaxID=1095629 RepID=A0A0C9XNV5_9AGAR|nr:hypothetical protein K443DRAFT_123975 [Laccaria amethystina LaAM-08-1]